MIMMIHVRAERESDWPLQLQLNRCYHTCLHQGIWTMHVMVYVICEYAGYAIRYLEKVHER